MFRPNKNIIDLIKLSCVRLRYSDNLSNRISHNYIKLKDEKKMEDGETLEELHSKYKDEVSDGVFFSAIGVFFGGYDPINHPIWFTTSTFFAAVAYDNYSKKSVMSDVIIHHFTSYDDKSSKRVDEEEDGRCD